MSWFTDIEDVVYSAVEFIPVVGTLYSVKRAAIAYHERDWKRHWLSMANFAESAIRDVIIFEEITEPQAAVVIHTIAESLTDKILDKFFEEEPPKFKVTTKLDKSRRHVIVAGSTKEKSEEAAKKLFTNKAKGIHQFHDGVFTGTLTHPKFAPSGEKIQLRLPQGFKEDATCTFMWKWTTDSAGAHNRPDYTVGRLRLDAGTPTGFGLKSRHSTPGWEGYDFWGKIKSISEVDVTASIDGSEYEITMTRKLSA